MRRYELMLLLRPDLEDDKLQAAVEKVTRAIVNGGGSLSKVSPWGKRRLAYDIGRNREASYFLIHFDIEPAQVREIERGMLITEEILRHLVTVLEDRETPDEIAPAAAPRSDEDPEVAEEDDTSNDTSDDTSSDDADDADGAPAPEMPETPETPEAPMVPETPLPEEPTEDAPGTKPAEEERAAG